MEATLRQWAILCGLDTLSGRVSLTLAAILAAFSGESYERDFISRDEFWVFQRWPPY